MGFGKSHFECRLILSVGKMWTTRVYVVKHCLLICLAFLVPAGVCIFVTVSTARSKYNHNFFSWLLIQTFISTDHVSSMRAVSSISTGELVVLATIKTEWTSLTVSIPVMFIPLCTEPHSHGCFLFATPGWVLKPPEWTCWYIALRNLPLIRLLLC